MRAFLAQSRIEVRTQTRRPFMWFCLVAYFLLGVGDTWQAGLSATGGVWINGADTLSTRAMIYSLLGALAAAGIVGEPGARDRSRSVSGVVLVTGSARFPLALPRFVVSTLIVVLAAGLSLVGVMVGSFAPGIPSEYVGPLNLGHYGGAFVFFLLPNLVVLSAFAFVVASRFQSQAAAFGAAVTLIAGWVSARMLLGQDVLRHDVFARYALLDPFGTIASAEYTMGRTVAENNTLFPPLRGILLVNRVVWLGVAAALIGVGVAAFPLRQRLPRGSQGRNGRGVSSAARILRRPADVLSAFGSPMRIAVWELRGVLRSPSAKIVGVLACFFLWWSASSAVTHQFSLPSTDLLVHNTGFYFDKVLILVIVWMAGELIWLERSHKFDGVVGVLPVPDTRFYLGKLIALITVVLGLWALSIIVNVTYQAVSGYHDFELWLHLTDSFVFKAPYYVFFAVLALTLQVVVRRRYIAMALVFVVYLSEVLLDALGLYHPVYRYGTTSFFWYSLMDGYGHFWQAHLWMLAHWAAGATLVGIIGCLLYFRGSNPPSRRRLLILKARTPRGGALIVGSLLCFVFTTAWVWHQSTDRAVWPPVDADALKAEVERTYGDAWRGVPQPRIVELTGDLNLYLADRSFTFAGVQTLHNPHNGPIDRLLVLAEPWVEVHSLGIDGGLITDVDARLNARVIELDEPIEPGEEVELAFETRWSAPNGFAVHAQNDGIPTVGPTEVIGNGTSLLNLQLMPAVGYTDRVEHKPVWKRRKYGLPDEWQAPGGPDAARQSHATLHLDWVRRVDMTIRTAPDQRAYHPGTLVEERIDDDGRAVFRYVMERPGRGWATIVSGRLVESRYTREGVPDVVMAHDPDHIHALDEFALALQDAIEHFQSRYGSPPFDEFLMVEQSLHFDGMGTRSGMGFASEVLGWKSDVRASGGEDLHAMAAHLMGMTWWGDQIIPANVAGAKVIHAGLPYWSAQLYLQQRRSSAVSRRARTQSAMEAFRGRSTLIDEEAPFDQEFKDSTMVRAKGAGQLLHLAELIGGPERLERVLASFLDAWRYRPAPYPTVSDFVEHLEANLPSELSP
ncbi:MAG: hypothetical protein AAGA55_04805, partial [Planctomycetota bacterium]